MKVTSRKDRMTKQAYRGRYLSKNNRHIPNSERGDLAIIVAILAVLLLSAIPLATYAATVNQLPLTRGSQDYQSALGAAESGVTDYLNRMNQIALNQAGNYWKYSASNLPPDGNGAFTGWVAVPGSTNEYFHYTPDASNTASTGIVYLTSTGIALHGAQTQTRTIKVALRTNGFLDYLLMTDTMMVDPSLAPNFDSAFNSAKAATTECGYKFSQPNDNAAGSPADSDSDSYSYDQNTTGPERYTCYGLINYYGTGQIFNGPLMTNDMYYLYGTPQFNARVYSGSTTTSGYSSHPYWIDPQNAYFDMNSSDNPTFIHPGDPSHQPALVFPTNNSSLANAAKAGGCIYYGPTSIVFLGSSMSVYSPETSSSATNAGCTGSGNLPLPANGAIYVNSLPSGQSCPVNTQITVGGNSFDCSQGEVAVQGTITGGITVGSYNNIYIDGNLEYTNCGSSSSNDVLGLVAQSFVKVSSNFANDNITPDNCFSQPSTNPVIMAAILTLNDSFEVQHFWDTSRGVLGTIYLDGSLAGKYADIEGSFNNGATVSGYNTTYTYDPRLAYLTPPFFLSPVNSAWKTVSSVETVNPSGLPAIP
ncbi:pilus assembly PilX N-terminal domain-containing protein [Acidithrix sp. C25]|uniref:pilus assembly PilX N-terminal domain-containing protein n=1 Tax=Acidithrix sp. C25 TaxID=1671482 RepID=UPI00191BA555|nr:pilus assembly PilX N-terminal domain-containing protein [Acidithrix sp. C25]CAG4930778.1 unnamed protein product [Acidithrix sp. C25]